MVTVAQGDCLTKATTAAKGVAVGKVRVSRRGGARGFKCSACDEWHAFGAYVAGHWGEELIHTCKCGAKHSVLRGGVKVVKN